MAKDETEVGITGKSIPKKKRSPKKQHEFEKRRRENLGQNVGGHTYSSDVTPHFNPRSVREEVLVDYLLGEGFASDEKSAQAIADAMSEKWRQSIVEGMSLSAAKLIGKLVSNPRTPEAQATKAAQKNITDPIGFGVKSAAKAVLGVGDKKNAQMMQKRRPN